MYKYTDNYNGRIIFGSLFGEGNRFDCRCSKEVSGWQNTRYNVAKDACIPPRRPGVNGQRKIQPRAD